MATVEMGQFLVNYSGIKAGEIFLEPTVLDADLREIFQIIPNIKNGKQKMLFAGKLDNFLRERKGCGFTPKGDMPIYDRCLTTTDVKGENSQCWDEFKDTILLEGLNSGLRKSDLNGTVLGNILMTRAQQGAKRQMELLAFFGQKGTLNVEQNFIDGLWTVFIPQAVGQNVTPRIDSNSGTALGTGDAIDLLDEVWDNATEELDAFDEADKVILIPRSVHNQLRKDLRDGATGSEAFITETMNGRTRLMFNGVEVKKMTRWDGLAASYMGTVLPGVTDNFNLVLYTHRRNFALGTNVESDMNRFDTWYERKDDEYCMRIAFEMGVDYVHGSLMSVAY
jgi:hypothetical protein